MQTVLFDMDGTLTQPRKTVDDDIIGVLGQLSKCANIGIVTGSPIEYVKDQMNPAFKKWTTDVTQRVTVYPCNGTQIYCYNDLTKDFEETYKVSIKDHLAKQGDPDMLYHHLVMNLLDLQSYALKKYTDLKPTGHFISFRESLVNWSMIGRESNHSSREKFISLDKSLGVRSHLKKILDERLRCFGLETITTALGGSTSIDIYPNQWDKTYVLNHVDEQTAWFFGDKCQPMGNDYALYKRLLPEGRSFEVTSPEDTFLKVLRLIKVMRA